MKETHIETVNLYWDYDPEQGVEDDLVGEIYMNDYDLGSKGAPASTSAPPTPSPTKKSTNAPKAISSGTILGKKVSPSKAVATHEDVNLDYNIVDNMKKMKVDIAMFDVSKLQPQQKYS